MRLIARKSESKRRGSEDRCLDAVGNGTSCLGVKVAAFYHDDYFTCRLIILVTVLFLARLFAVDIYKDGGLLPLYLSLLAVSYT